MTVVAAPLLLALDGTLLARNNANAASYLLDPMDYSREGLVRAVKRSAPSEGIATMLAKSEHYYPGYYAKYLLTHGCEDFRMQVMPYLQDDDAHVRIVRFIDRQKARLVQDPDAFAQLEAQRKQAIKHARAVRRDYGFYTQQMKALSEAELPELGDSGSENYAQMHRHSKQKLSDALGRMGRFKNIADHYGLVFASVNYLEKAMRCLAQCTSYQTILIDGKILRREPLSWTMHLLKEEIMHFADHQLGFSETPEFRQAAEALYSDPARIAMIDILLESAHYGQKAGILQMCERLVLREHLNAELLVEYIHLKDYLQVRLPQAEASQKLQMLFGDTLFALGETFDAELSYMAHQPARASTRATGWARS